MSSTILQIPGTLSRLVRHCYQSLRHGWRGFRHNYLEARRIRQLADACARAPIDVQPPSEGFYIDLAQVDAQLRPGQKDQLLQSFKPIAVQYQRQAGRNIRILTLGDGSKIVISADAAVTEAPAVAAPAAN